MAIRTGDSLSHMHRDIILGQAADDGDSQARGRDRDCMEERAQRLARDVLILAPRSLSAAISRIRAVDTGMRHLVAQELAAVLGGTGPHTLSSNSSSPSSHQDARVLWWAADGGCIEQPLPLAPHPSQTTPRAATQRVQREEDRAAAAFMRSEEVYDATVALRDPRDLHGSPLPCAVLGCSLLATVRRTLCHQPDRQSCQEGKLQGPGEPTGWQQLWQHHQQNQE